MTKQELRKQYLEKRMRLSDDDYRMRCEDLCNNFFSTVDLSDVKVIHVFLPITKKREPDTFIIIARLQKEHPSIKIAVPKVNGETNTLESYYLNSTSELVTTAWGIPEPPSTNPVAPEEIDIVLIPLLVFDVTGNRLGYGKGFYDKFLLTCNPQCKKIGISLLPPIVRIDAIEDHDQKLDLAVTPIKTFEF